MPKTLVRITAMITKDGKYEYVVHEDGSAEILRYGESWRDVTGDHFIGSIVDELAEDRLRYVELRSVCRTLVAALWMCNAYVLPQETQSAIDKALSDFREVK